jgi:hypothetical protein
VAAAIVLARGADLDLHSKHGGIRVEDQRADVIADVQHDGLGVRPRAVVLLAARVGAPTGTVPVHGVGARYAVADGKS